MTAFPPALRQEVLVAIEPGPELNRAAKNLVRKLSADLRKEIQSRGLKATPTLVGSLAKDTHLATHLDIDLFVLFPRTTTREQLEGDGIALGKAVIPKPVLRYAEHPYVHGKVGSFDVDIVPAYRLRDPRGKLSAVDRTPFHTRFVRNRATDRHRREIRLLKAFLRGTGCYGAETATGGVSGYLAELLILKFGTFPKSLAAIAKWIPPVELALDGPIQPLGGPVVFVDPVDPSRNAAAALTGPTLVRLQRAARAFRERPRRSFFFPEAERALPKKDLEKALRIAPILGIAAPAPPGRPETRRPQGQRLMAKMNRQLEGEGFEVVRAEVFLLADDQLLLLIEHRPLQLSPTVVHRGPPSADAANSARFLEKWGNHKPPPRENKGRWEVETDRDAKTPSEIISPRLAILLDGFGHPRGVEKRCEVLSGAALARDARRHVAMTEFVQQLDPWDRPPPGKAS